MLRIRYSWFYFNDDFFIIKSIKFFIKQTAAVESAYAIKYNLKNQLVIKFSEQQIIDCSVKNNGCNGGFVYYALEYVKNNGLEAYSSYPYQSNVDF